MDFSSVYLVAYLLLYAVFEFLLSSKQRLCMPPFEHDAHNDAFSMKSQSVNGQTSHWRNAQLLDTRRDRMSGDKLSPLSLLQYSSLSTLRVAPFSESD